jgi:nickel-dependent lactate racemase
MKSLKLRLDYGQGALAIELPSANVTVIEPVYVPGAANPAALLREALRTPIGKPPLRQLVRSEQRVAISVCDITRAQPRRAMIEALFSEMPGISSNQVTIFIATGTHRANTDAEIQNMLGREIAQSCRVICHNARDEASLVFLGKTRTGVPIHLNREWMESDFRITTGFVEPHFFAGFSGGPKMVAPGLAGLETVLHLHDVSRIGHPNATWGVTQGNPVHDDVREISLLTGVDFAFDVTLNRKQEITAAFAGDILAEHAAACSAAQKNAMRAVSRPFDVVVTTNSGYPLDQNLYQAVKGMSAAARVVKSGGTIICAAECRDGIPDHGAYGRILASRSSAEELLAMIMAPGFSTPDQWQVQIQAQIQLRARVLVKAEGLSAEQIRAAHFEPVEDVEKAVKEAMLQAGPTATVCVLPHGPQTIPYLQAFH